MLRMTNVVLDMMHNQFVVYSGVGSNIVSND